MLSVADIKKAVEALPDKELNLFSTWFDAFEERRWDKQIECDQGSMPLHSLMEEAMAEYKAGKCSPI